MQLEFPFLALADGLTYSRLLPRARPFGCASAQKDEKEAVKTPVRQRMQIPQYFRDGWRVPKRWSSCCGELHLREAGAGASDFYFRHLRRQTSDPVEIERHNPWPRVRLKNKLSGQRAATSCFSSVLIDFPQRIS